MAPKPLPQNFWQALGYAGELGYTIAVPLVIFALAGRIADQRLHTSPWLLLAGIIVSIVVSSILLVRKATAILRSVEQSTQDKKENNDGASH